MFMASSKSLKLAVGLMTGLVSAEAAHAKIDIIGGNLVATTEAIARRTVGLYFSTLSNGQQGAGICTGSILDSSHILTAAHCIQGYQSGFVVFSSDQMFPLIQQASHPGVQATSGRVQAMTGVVEIPGFPGMQNTSISEFVDLAIVSFSGGLAPGYEPAHFLPKNTVLASLKPNTLITLSGYGMSSAPSAAPLTAAPKGKAMPTQKNFGFPDGVGVLREVGVAFESLSAKQIDISVSGPAGHIACEGDSGGPSMLQMNGDVYVIGVASRSDCISSSIYTLVDRENLANVVRFIQAKK